MKMKAERLHLPHQGIEKESRYPFALVFCETAAHQIDVPSELVRRAIRLWMTRIIARADQPPKHENHVAPVEFALRSQLGLCIRERNLARVSSKRLTQIFRGSDLMR
jgi:hypothetical protein